MKFKLLEHHSASPKSVNNSDCADADNRDKSGTCGRAGASIGMAIVCRALPSILSAMKVIAASRSRGDALASVAISHASRASSSTCVRSPLRTASVARLRSASVMESSRGGRPGPPELPEANRPFAVRPFTVSARFFSVAFMRRIIRPISQRDEAALGWVPFMLEC